jgi:hypothetical protein
MFPIRRLASQSLVQVRNQSTFAKYLPDLSGVNGQTTLGNLSERLYTKYRYRLVWPIAGWIGFLYVTLWEE